MSRVGMLITPKRFKLIAVYASHQSTEQSQLSIHLLVIAPRMLGRAIILKLSNSGIRWRSIKFLS